MGKKREKSKSRPFPEIPLSAVEPYFVFFVLLSGVSASFGVTMGNTALLVIVAWLVFIMERRELLRSRGLLPLVPAITAALSGAMASIMSPIGGGAKDAIFALTGAGLAWVLLPELEGRDLGWNRRARLGS